MLDLLEVGILGCRSCDMPVDPNCKLGETDGECLLDVGKYQRLVGKLIYLSLTKPDISYAVGLVNQFMHAPTTVHLEAVYKILRYLKKNPSMGLLYKKSDTLQVEAYIDDTLLVEGYTNVDCAGSMTDRRSTSRYCTFVGANLVTWISKK